MNRLLLLLLSTSLVPVVATSKHLTRVRGQITCKGVEFNATRIELYEEVSGTAVDPQDFIKKAKLWPAGRFYVSGKNKEPGAELKLSIKHQCRKWKILSKPFFCYFTIFLFRQTRLLQYFSFRCVQNLCSQDLHSQRSFVFRCLRETKLLWSWPDWTFQYPLSGWSPLWLAHHQQDEELLWENWKQNWINIEDKV